VQFVDANGDGRTDLLVTQGTTAGYYPMQFNGRWSRGSFQRYAYAPSFDLKDPEVRLIDLDGDGVTDAIRSGSRLECFFNDRREGWRPDNTRWASRESLDVFPNVNFSDPHVKWADMSGDGLQDIVLVYDGNVEYWPNLGYGNWGVRLHMRNSPRLPFDADPQRILVGDVNGDGLADIVYVDHRRVLLWINQSGNGWSAPIEIHGTPPVTNIDSLRLTDLLGSGVSGVLWTRDAHGTNEASYWFLDFTRGNKPYLMQEIDNNRGAVTRVTYRSSTSFYVDDDQRRMRWRTSLPFPVQVVARMEVRDQLSHAALVTEYRYHHGYWDGREREFRGFGMVEQLDTESFISYRDGRTRNDATFDEVEPAQYSPPTLTKTWFHLGAVEQDDGDAIDAEWHEIDWQHEHWEGDRSMLRHIEVTDASLLTLDAAHGDLTTAQRRRIRRDALRSLRGSVLRTELYALDGAIREGRPYTVTEHAYQVREVALPGRSDGDRLSVFFPSILAQRATQWERGDDPLTTVSYTRQYDAFGNPGMQINIACPRGWRRMSDAIRGARYLATVTRTEIAVQRDADIYLHDRASRIVSYEVLNTPIPIAPDTVGRTLAQVLNLIDSAANLRVIAEVLNFYDADDDAPNRGAFEGLPQGVVGRYGLVTHSETLALTAETMTAVYGTTPEYLEPGETFTDGPDYPAGFVQRLQPTAGYVFRAAAPAASYAGGYYVATRKRFDFHGTGRVRGLLLAERDPLGAETVVEYEQPYDLLAVSLSNAAGLVTRLEHNYRVLQPRLLTDPNGNRTQVDFAAVGHVSAMWVRGKANQGEGDVAVPSSTFEYDFRAFFISRRIDPSAPEPVFVRTQRRTHHDSDPAAGQVIEIREYSDGFGRLLQTRSQSEAVRFGDAIFGGGASVLPADPRDGSGAEVRGQLVADAVVVSGWQRYDNKGRVVEKFEPFFATGWRYAPPRDDPDPRNRDLGVRVRMFYDPRGQVVRTLNPDGSEQLVVYGVPERLDAPTDPNGVTPTPWEAYTYDSNDNAGRTHAQSAAAYRHHWNTPASIEIDALGRTVLSVVRTRARPAQDAEPLPAIEEHRTRSTYDIQGNLLILTDALNRPAFTYAYDLLRRAIQIESIDAGYRTVVHDAFGQEIERWDGKQARLLRSYDVLNRPARLWARDATGEALTLREQWEYGDAGVATQPQNDRNAARAANQLGRLIRQGDQAGELRFTAYDFKGNVREKVRSVVTDGPLLAALDAPGGPARRFVLNWDAPPPLEGAYEISSTYDALNRVTAVRCPRDVAGNRATLTPAYNRAGALEGVSLDGDAFVERLAYDARGQRVLVAYGNGVMTRYAYDSRTFRLRRLRTEPFTPAPALSYQLQGSPLQDLEYAYDLAGNVLSVTERTPGCGVRNNPEAWRFGDLAVDVSAGDALVRRFGYDPLYRLTSATGREATGIPMDRRPWEDLARDGFDWGRPGTPSVETARDLTRIYTENYAYDATGNLVEIDHGSWTRRFGMSGYTPQGWAQAWLAHLAAGSTWLTVPSNRLTHVDDDQPGTVASHAFDDNGNLVREHTERHFAWDAHDRLVGFANRAGGGTASVDACFLYDSAGLRVKKLVRKGTAVDVTVYVERIFEHHVGDGGENTMMHVLDDQRRIAVVRVGPPLQGDTGPDVQYHLGDHLGSANVVVGGDDPSARAFVNREELFPYGETSFGSFGKKRYRFIGKERDEESGLVYHGARFYAPWIARWIATDPASLQRHEGATAGRAESTYAYVDGNPMQFVDPDGNEKRNFFIYLKGGADDAYLTNAEALSKQQKGFTSFGVNNLDEVVSGLKSELKPGDTIGTVRVYTHGLSVRDAKGRTGFQLPSAEAHGNMQIEDSLEKAALRLETDLREVRKSFVKGSTIEFHGCSLGNDKETMKGIGRFFGQKGTKVTAADVLDRLYKSNDTGRVTESLEVIERGRDGKTRTVKIDISDKKARAHIKEIEITDDPFPLEKQMREDARKRTGGKDLELKKVEDTSEIRVDGIDPNGTIDPSRRPDAGRFRLE
jgi:RHS repeat-associated protein